MVFWLLQVYTPLSEAKTLQLRKALDAAHHKSNEIYVPSLQKATGTFKSVAINGMK